MRSGVLPTALLFLTLGLSLARVRRQRWLPSLILLCAALAGSSFIAMPRAWAEQVYFGCWVSIVATGASVYIGPRLTPGIALALSANAGFWAGTLTSLAGSRADVWKALPAVLILFPASWLIRRQASIVIQVISSWVIAIAVLAATLQVLPVTPGYLPDHLE